MSWEKILFDMEKMCCPAGDGVYTVSTGGKIKQELQHLLYGPDNNFNWLNHLKKFREAHLPCILGVPSDSGGGILRGANWGPLYCRKALYQKINPETVIDLGDVRVIPQLLTDATLNHETISACRMALYNSSDNHLPVSPLSITDYILTEIYGVKPKAKILALGGDHSVSYGLILPWIKSRRALGKRPAVLHFDAHTDLLQQRLGLDITFGSWAYHIIDELVDPGDLIQVGLRASKKDKKTWEKELGVHQFWADEIRHEGAHAIAKKINHILKPLDELYITFDIDCIDALYVSATGTPEPNGVMPEEAYIILAEVLRFAKLTAADITEVAPFIRHDIPQSAPEPQSTLSIASEVAKMLLKGLA